MIFLELIQFEVFNDFVVAVFADDGHTEGETFRDAVRTVGRNSHRGPFTVAAENPVMDVIDGGVSSAGSGRMAASLNNGAPAFGNSRDQFVDVPVFSNQIQSRFAGDGGIGQIREHCAAVVAPNC